MFLVEQFFSWSGCNFDELRSAVDICRDIAGIAKEVHVASRSVANETYEKQLRYTSTVTVDDNHVGPLYKHIFPVLAPWLFFCWVAMEGCPLVPFPMYELQSKWIAGLLSGQIMLLSQEEMMEDVKAFYLTLKACGSPKRYTHRMGDSRFALRLQ